MEKLNLKNIADTYHAEVKARRAEETRTYATEKILPLLEREAKAGHYKAVVKIENSKIDRHELKDVILELADCTIFLDCRTLVVSW